MRNVRTLAVVVSAAAALAACDAPTRSARSEQPPAAAAARLDPMFARAASEFSVPVELLKAVAFTETGWQFARGEHSDMEGMPAAYGIFALRGERLERGAQLAGVTVEAAQTDVEASIRAGAALLRAEGEALRVAGSDLGAWAPAVASFSGISNDQAQAEYVHSGVFRALREGVADVPHATLAPRPGVRAAMAPPVTGPRLTTEYGPAIWTASPNYTAGRSYSLALVVIHTCAGNYSGCWSWLTNPSSGVSAHYVVGQTDIGGGVTEVRQLVDEDNTAWHVGKYWQGYPTNPRSVGIEHGGFSYGSNGYGPWPAVQYNTSVKLTCDVVKSRNIIRDRDHIIGHYQPDPVNRAHDPGQGFPWADYMSKINTCVSGTTGGTAITVDSHAGTSGTTARFSASTNWISSAGTSGYYGSGYYYASTAAVSDAANFEFYLPSAATRAVSAWWTSGTNRSTTAPYIMYNASGAEVGRRSVNQQAGGGAWQSLGSYAFSAGWNRVSLSRWTTTGYVVIADAVKIE
jgi:N-acetyl-anhydromuramyl-L-alanine amidase AmpD